LENHAILNQFEEIEKKVVKLIEVCQSLETANLEFSNQIKRLEEELQNKIEAEHNYQEERALIRSKIDGLLGRIEQITEAQE
jgi:hypothetical protein